MAGERRAIWALSLSFLAVIGSYVFLVLVMPRIASQVVMDMVIGVIMWAFLSIVFDSVSDSCRLPWFSPVYQRVIP